MDIRSISKAIAGCVMTVIAGMGTTAIMIPTDVPMPWWGYILVAVLNGVIGFAGVYYAPPNRG